MVEDGEVVNQRWNKDSLGSAKTLVKLDPLMRTVFDWREAEPITALRDLQMAGNCHINRRYQLELGQNGCCQAMHLLVPVSTRITVNNNATNPPPSHQSQPRQDNCFNKIFQNHRLYRFSSLVNNQLLMTIPYLSAG